MRCWPPCAPPPQALALDLYGNDTDGQVTIENPSQEYGSVIGWTEASGKNELDGGSVLAKNLSAYRIFGAGYILGSGESVIVTNNKATVENVRQNAAWNDHFLRGAHVQVSSTADITAKFNSLKVTGTVSGVEGSANNALSVIGAFVSSAFSDSSAEVLLQDNKVLLDGVKVQAWVAVGIAGGNGFSMTSTPIVLSSNEVTIVNSDILAKSSVLIQGAFTNSMNLSQKVLGNVVSIRDSNIVADGRVVVSGGTTYEYDDQKTKITGNQVQLHNAYIDGSVYGGSYNLSEGIEGYFPVDKGNSIKISGVNSATSIGGFDTLYVEVSDVNATSPILTLSEDLDLADRNLNVSGYDGFSVKEGNTYSLISAPSIKGLDNERVTLESTWLAYDAKLSVETGENNTDNLSLTTIAVQPTDNSKTLSESFLGTIAFVNQGAEFIADEGMRAMADAVTVNEVSVFGAVHGGTSRYETGSHVDVDGVTLATGAVTKVGNLMLAGFVEAGWATSESHVSGTKGDGDHDYYGFGAALRYSSENPFYIDASARFGWASAKFDGRYADASAKYDADSLYGSMHVGAGYVFGLTEKTDLDVYGRYVLTYLEGDSAGLGTPDGDTFDMDDTVTHAFRIGARLTGAINDSAGWRFGLAYEHVADGDAESDVIASGTRASLDVPTLEGDTGIVEAGITVRPNGTSPWSANIGIKGYVGDRGGVSGNASIVYSF